MQMRWLCIWATLAALLTGCGIDFRSDLEKKCEKGHGKYNSWSEYEYHYGVDSDGAYTYHYGPVTHESCEYPPR